MTAVPLVMHLWFMRTEAFLRPTIRNIRRPYIHINTQEGDLISSTLAFPSTSIHLHFHFPTMQHHGACEEDGCRWHLGPSS
jgi:hypothetical protein